MPTPPDVGPAGVIRLPYTPVTLAAAVAAEKALQPALARNAVGNLISLNPGTLDP